ncbi:MAG TPA: xanthine dehydrogenase family protein molybdopterin-binding subunit [Vicinamibacterales bacterium]|nr:xanthine dehydrogenase family protein molybdopterin-binding subunit [Vicinamibacterales bacterium]
MASQGRGNQPQAPPVDPKYQWSKTPTVVGTRVKRLDGPDKVSGRAKYTFDVTRPGMLYGRIIRSPYPHARVVAVDLSAAQRIPGFKTALVSRDPSDTKTNVVMYQGDEVAAVAADTEEHAMDAARAVKVTYEPLPAVINVSAALAGQAPEVFEGGNVRDGRGAEAGDLAGGFQAAAFTIEQTYETPVITHVCMETHGTVCEWEGDKLTAWISTQGVNGMKENFARGLEIPSANVRVICQYMGGGFGSKTQVGAEGLICARLAKQAGAPVKLMLDRKEEHLVTGNRPSAAARIKAGVSKDGIITAFDAESWGTGGAGAPAGFPLPYIYQIENRRRTHKDVFINTGTQRPMRAPGHPQGSFIMEIMMDELADKVNMDPVEFRIKNLPPEAPNAMWRSYIREGAEAFGWNKRHPTGDPTPGSLKTGMGVAVCTWGGGGRGPSVAHCEIASDGSVVMRVGTQDIGTGERTVVAMVTADALGLPLSRVTAEIGDTQYGVSGSSGGSTTAASTSPGIRIAALKALELLNAKVAPVLGVSPDALVASGGRIYVKDTPSKGLSWADACKRIGPQPITTEADWQPGMSSVTTSGVQFAEATVDVKTGIVRVTRVLAIQDCGLVLNQLTAESQCYGGIVGSLNFALFEDRILDRRTGQMVNPNMEWYLLAGMSDIPPIEIRLKNQPERGVIGIGEPPTVPTAAAVALAVRNAIGATVRKLPLTPATILESLSQKA